MKAVNLLPPDLGRTSPKKSAPSSPAPPAAGGAGPFVVLGALALAVVAVAAYVLTTNTIKDREAELARAKADTSATIAQADALKPYADFQTMATARVATVAALAGSRFDWERSLRDLSRALPADVHLTSLNGTLGGVTASGGGGSNPLRGAITAPAIELAGCTKTHSDVARLMSRLRNVRGVTRVSLASSEKEQLGTAAPTNTTVEGDTPAQLCPKGSPPKFQLVVFFEGSNAVASGAEAPVGSTGPTGPTGPTGSTASSGATTTPASTTGAP